jgi:hypothetical protein
MRETGEEARRTPFAAFLQYRNESLRKSPSDRASLLKTIS